MPEGNLKQFIEQIGGASHLRVEADLGDGFVRLNTSEAERRQAAQDIRCTEDIVIELLRNARDAHASHIFIALAKSQDARKIVVIDDGDGIPASMHEHIFEPRVTSKLDTMRVDSWGVHGRGMALYSIAANSELAYVSASAKGLGSSIVVQTNTSKLKEKKDQSSFPRFSLNESHTLIARGPKNIIRSACEFALESRNLCEVYLGSFAEVEAGLLALGREKLNEKDLLFAADCARFKVPYRLATASDPASFAHISASLGLESSERTARRVLNGKISAPVSLLEQIEAQLTAQVLDNGRNSLENAKATRSIARNDSLKISHDDKREFLTEVMNAYAKLAESYYLESEVEADCRLRDGQLYIRIPVARVD